MNNDLTDRLAHLLSGYWHTQAISVAAKLDIASHLKDGPRSADDLAHATGTHPQALYRLVRALATLGIFAEDEKRRIVLTPLAECLLDPATRAMAIMRGDFQYHAWGELLYSIQTCKSGFEKVYGKPIFDYFAENPEMGKLFDQAMTGVHGKETEAMLEAYDFSGIKTLADIGGGNGSVLTTVLKKYPAMKGILFDLPGVAARTRDRIRADGLEDRCQVIEGSFFEAVPGADAYLMRHIIHDWDDEKSLLILRNCCQAGGAKGKLLLVEGVVPQGNEPSVSKFFDLAMMVGPGGMERTDAEYRVLFEKAGFRLARIVPTRTWVSLIEGEAK